jgi:hypothetical protein
MKRGFLYLLDPSNDPEFFWQVISGPPVYQKKNNKCNILYSVEITYGINSVISKLMTFLENAETGQFLFLIMLILSWFICS